MPTEYYLTNQTTASTDEMEKIIIARGSSHKLKFDVVEVDSILLWEFVSVDYDISFGVFLLDGDGRKVEVVRPNGVTWSTQIYMASIAIIVLHY